MKSLSSLLVVITALLLDTANILQCTQAQKLKDGPGRPMVHPHERSQPKDILIGSGLPINPIESTQPKTIDDCEDEFQKPTGRDLNERKLRRRLGGKIDERFLSVTKPALMSDEPVVERVSLRGVTTEEKDFLRRVIRNETVPRMGKTSVFLERFLMKWLIHKSDCPLQRTWKHLGFCYWPRWLSVSYTRKGANITYVMNVLLQCIANWVFVLKQTSSILCFSF